MGELAIARGPDAGPTDALPTAAEIWRHKDRNLCEWAHRTQTSKKGLRKYFRLLGFTLSGGHHGRVATARCRGCDKPFDRHQLTATTRECEECAKGAEGTALIELRRYRERHPEAGRSTGLPQLRRLQAFNDRENGYVI